MAKNPNARPAAAKPKTVITPASVVIVGVACLAAGLLTGYYFGSQSNQFSASVPAAAVPQNAAALTTPVAFAQDEAGLKAALSANPNDLNTIIQLGNLYYDNGRFQDAATWYGRALDIDPKNVSVRTDRGTSYWNIGQADQAIAEFRKSLEISPTHAQTLYNLGVVELNGKNDPQEARKAWEKLLQTNPNYPDRAKVEQQLASLPAGPGSASPGMQQMLERMKSRPK